MSPTHSGFVAEVIVVGGGTAGTAAAIAAAREGRDVLLVEEGNALGGVSTSGGVNEWYASLEGLGAIFDEVRDTKRAGGAKFGRFFNVEYLKIIWQLMAQRAGVRILLNTMMVGAEAAGGRVRAVRLASCGNVFEARGAVFIDASGEGDLAAAAGAEFMKGHPQTGRTLHMTLTFCLADTGRPVAPFLPPDFEPITEEAGLPGLISHNRMPDRRVYCNMTKVMGHDPTDPLSLSAAELEARRQLVRVVHFLQSTKYPTHTLVSSGAKIGIREGRRILGETLLTEEDIGHGVAPVDFSDGVAVATCQIDFHSLTKPGHVGWRKRVEPYAIPYGCLVPRGFRNLLVAGKCISVDQVVHSSCRMTPTCCGLGQAAGTAAALALTTACEDLRALDVGRLRERLVAQRVELDPRRHKAFAPEVTEDATRGA